MHPRQSGGVVGKDGRVRVFDPYRLPGLTDFKSEQEQLSTAHYGQVSFYYDKDKDKPYLFAASGG